MEDQKTPLWLTNNNNVNNLSNSDHNNHHHHHHHHHQNLQQIMKHHHQQQDIKDSEKPWLMGNNNNNNNNLNSREFNMQPHGFLHLNHEINIPSTTSSANPNNTELHQTNNNISVQSDLHQTSNNNITVQTELLNQNRHSHGLNIPSSDPLSVSVSGAPPSLQCLLQPNTSSSSSSASSSLSSSSSLSLSSSSLSSRLKAEITVHPLYNQLLSAHVACLRIATPVDQLPLIDAQIARSPQVNSKYLQVLGNASSGNLHQKLIDGTDDREELDQFMAHYVLLLCTFKEQLQQHVKVHAMEAVMACWDLEQSLLTLTGVSPGEATGATMSDDDDDDGYVVGDREDEDLGNSMLVDSINGHHHDLGGYGPLIPTETERTLMEKVRQELKNELKNGYKERIVDVREEILRKRRAGKLPGDTTSVLKSWWHCHAKWPYPTEDEKARLVQETGLQLKQINNWFINQRKRNWHSNPSSSSSLKAKRKR